MSEQPDPGPGPQAPDDTPPTSAEVLVAEVTRGSTAAFEELYAVIAPRVYGLALRVLRDPGLAQDVTQEVLVDVWRLAPRYDAARGPVITWVLTMAHRRSVDRVRREQSQSERAARAARSAWGERTDRDVVVGELERTWEAAVVRRAMRGLTELQRQAIELAYYGGCTHAEVAGMLGIPLGTAKTRIRDGLIRLRDSLGMEER